MSHFSSSGVLERASGPSVPASRRDTTGPPHFPSGFPLCKRHSDQCCTRTSLVFPYQPPLRRHQHCLDARDIPIPRTAANSSCGSHGRSATFGPRGRPAPSAYCTSVAGWARTTPPGWCSGAHHTVPPESASSCDFSVLLTPVLVVMPTSAI